MYIIYFKVFHIEMLAATQINCSKSQTLKFIHNFTFVVGCRTRNHNYTTVLSAALKPMTAGKDRHPFLYLRVY